MHGTSFPPAVCAREAQHRVNMSCGGGSGRTVVGPPLARGLPLWSQLQFKVEDPLLFPKDLGVNHVGRRFLCPIIGRRASAIPVSYEWLLLSFKRPDTWQQQGAGARVHNQPRGSFAGVIAFSNNSYVAGHGT